jgi:hypothetical protein
MKLVKHGDTVVAVIEHQWETAYLMPQQEKQEWVELFLVGKGQPSRGDRSGDVPGQSARWSCSCR